MIGGFARVMNEIKDEINIEETFGPYANLLTEQKNSIYAAITGTETFLKRGENILRYTVLDYGECKMTYFFFVRNTIGKLIEEIFYESLWYETKTFEEIKHGLPEYSSAIYGEGYLLGDAGEWADQERCYEILQELVNNKFVKYYECDPSPFFVTDLVKSYSEAEEIAKIVAERMKED